MVEKNDNPHEDIVLKTAHDIRHLRTCARCGQLGDNRRMVEMVPTQPNDRWHPRCFYEEFGEAVVLQLRREHIGKFRMCDIPVALMKKLVNSFY